MKEALRGLLDDATVASSLVALRSYRWRISELAFETPPPPPKPVGGMTLRDLYSACGDIVAHNGAGTVALLLSKYNVKALADLRADQFDEFYADARMAFETPVTGDQREAMGAEG